MQFNPNKRPTAKEALRHPYVVQFHNPDDEFDCDQPIRIPIDDNTKLTVQDYRDRLYNEVLRKKKEQRRSHRRNLELQQQQQQQMQATAPQAYGASQGTSSMHSSGHRTNSTGHRSSHSSTGGADAQYQQHQHQYKAASHQEYGGGQQYGGHPGYGA